ncbi:MAG: hypothetical protein FWF94_08230 [Oscillospiraceae bacterium]|nr:hypothetical protein [Oscillospiraceae bacterium]
MVEAFFNPNFLLLDIQFSKKQLETVRNAHASKSSFYDFKNVYSYAANLDKLMEEKGFCMLVRQGEFFKKIMKKYKDNCLVIYSMWTGYINEQERAKNQGLIDLLAGYKYRVLHTSGHASPKDIKKLYETVKPTCGLIPIHTDSPELFEELIPDGKIIILDDGEQYML